MQGQGLARWSDNMVRTEIGANAFGTSNPFTGIALALVVAFLVSGAATFITLVETTPVQSNHPGAHSLDGEIVLLDTTTGKIVPMGIEVPRMDLSSVKLDLTGDIVTFYSNGEFRTFDIGALKAKDEFTPASYDPTIDTYKSNGHFLAVFSNTDNTLTVRETVAQNGGHPVSSIPGPSSSTWARNMTADGDTFYWATVNGSGQGSIIYKYDRMTNTTTQVRSVRDQVTDLAAGGGRIAYSYMVYGRSYITMVDLTSGRAWTACNQCLRPRISGSTFAAVASGSILVQNTSSGRRSDIDEHKQVVDLRVEGDKVAWSWYENVDPITVKNLRTGKTYTYQPDHTVYTFAMSGDRILMLRSKTAFSQPITVDPSVRLPMALTGTFIFGALFMGGLATALESHRRNEKKLVEESQWAEHWTKVREQELYGWMEEPAGQSNPEPWDDCQDYY